MVLHELVKYKNILWLYIIEWQLIDLASHTLNIQNCRYMETFFNAKLMLTLL